MSKSSFPDVVAVGGRLMSELRADLDHAGVSLNRAAEALLGDSRFLTSAVERQVELGVFTLIELGLESGATYPQCVARARELGYSECPLELAAALRLAYAGQPVAPERPADAEPGSPSGAITVASAPLDASEETPRGFYLRNINGTLWLRGYWSDDEHVWAPDDLFVFLRNEG